MLARKSIFLAAAVTAVVAGSALSGCNGYNPPTSPSGGGGGGGGGTAFDSGTLNPPATYVRTFPTAGMVGYHCRFHVSMGMTGTVTVADGAADSAVVTAAGMTFTPASVSIKPGGYVHWKLTDGPHTVTSN
jgi:plastocyanin